MLLSRVSFFFLPMILSILTTYKDIALAADYDITMKKYGQSSDLIDIDVDGPLWNNFTGCCLQSHSSPNVKSYICYEFSCKKIASLARASLKYLDYVKINLDSQKESVSTSINGIPIFEGYYNPKNGTGEISYSDDNHTFSINWQ